MYEIFIVPSIGLSYNASIQAQCRWILLLVIARRESITPVLLSESISLDQCVKIKGEGFLNSNNMDQELGAAAHLAGEAGGGTHKEIL